MFSTWYTAAIKLMEIHLTPKILLLSLELHILSQILRQIKKLRVFWFRKEILIRTM